MAVWSPQVPVSALACAGMSADIRSGLILLSGVRLDCVRLFPLGNG